jgi:hypothetical protein
LTENDAGMIAQQPLCLFLKSGRSNNLRDLGFDFHEREVDHDVAREAWSRLRTAFYELRATRPDPIGGEVPWAEREFGNPDYPV